MSDGNNGRKISPFLLFFFSSHAASSLEASVLGRRRVGPSEKSRSTRSISYAQFLIGSHYNWLGADLSLASRGCTKPRVKNLWRPWYERMRTTLRFPPSHHAQQRFNERRLRTIHSRLLSFKVRCKVACVQTYTIFPVVKLETSAHRLGAGCYYICLRFHCRSDAVSRRTIIITTRFFVLWLF